MMDIREKFDHPSWFSVGGAAFGYLAILILMFVLLFVVPFAFFYLT
jgi:hypothetical protein